MLVVAACRESEAEHLDQKIAKELLPPNSYLWRSRSVNSWCSRYKKYPIKVCADTAWKSEGNALEACIKHAWSWFLQMHTLQEANCPVKGLF